MRRAVIALLLFGAVLCISAFFADAAGHAGTTWPIRAGNPAILILAGVAGLTFACAAIGLIAPAFPVKRPRAIVVVAATVSLTLCAACPAPWTVCLVLVDAVLLWGVVAKGRPTGVGRAMPASVASARRHPLLDVPVPWVFVLAYFMGVGLNVALPVFIHETSVLLACRISGAVSMSGGLTLAACCLGLFRVVRTTTVPGESSSALVVSGPYRLCRNPMYVGLTLMYLGEAGMLAQIWPVLVLPLVLVYLSRTVIPLEEARLRDVFADAYRDYCSRVRRWV